MSKLLICLLIPLFFIATTLIAGEADVVGVKISKNKSDAYDFDVSVFHEDTGWEHYANKWEILDEKGNVLGTRVLHHPHVGEQPFERELLKVQIKSDVTHVIVRAHDLIHKYGGKTIKMKLP
ncbi:hypothetical protein KKA14_00440 [bacterium]|nr:hypothetical protein [bacterium]